MDKNTKPNALPEKVVRRHAEMIAELLPALTRLVIEEGRPADTLLNRHLRDHRELGSRDRRFLSQAIFSYFRWYGWTVNKLGLGPSEACLLGSALDSDELSQSIQFLATRCKLGFRAEPMGYMSVAEKRNTLNERLKNTPDFQPLELADLVLPDFAAVLNPDVIDQCIVEFQQRPPTWTRARTDPAEFMKTLAKHKISGAEHSRAAAAVAIEGGVSLTHALGSNNAQYVVQDISSQCVGLVCNPQKGEDWWDCCAGAGGKSIQLIDLMQQEGKVLASDIRIPALKELKKRTRRYGIKNIRSQPFNAINDEPFRKTFDGVLVDAPCSGWGTWSRNPDARWRASRRDVIQCAGRQLKILDNAKWCVKPGGVLVYAVCTLTRPETEEVVMNFLDQHADFKLDPFVHPLTGEMTDGKMQIWPWDASNDAMFIARFIRKEDS
ncbi:RsmB/NOP family class I SAM-dependent RNA methyltransferase [Pontiella sulfatireligans]|uniref:Ribosomal RNA small subunit methyltransferase F n=1 Tax=Pontiella sulfatireligans TaxID=2750658 RepID=A0A6C2UMP9_9BACT|nr:RsmB/NOP family class I SAM-dependent RNA methyltransferase [Pontiella sulfatireligans]VGO21545.1 Ribosomal RNA small subunit methyltransferase F [Pontiella sulfatireligans]